MNIPNYIEAIHENHPDLQVQTNSNAYEDLKLLPNTSGAIPDKATLDAEVMKLAQDRMWEEIKDCRDVHSQEGGSKVGNYWFHSDQASRTQQIALVILGANMPAGLMWKTMSGVFIPMTPTLAMQVFGAAVQLDQLVFTAAETHRQRMMASSTPWSYDYTTPYWPKTYDQAKALGETP